MFSEKLISNPLSYQKNCKYSNIKLFINDIVKFKNIIVSIISINENNIIGKDINNTTHNFLKEEITKVFPFYSFNFHKKSNHKDILNLFKIRLLHKLKKPNTKLSDVIKYKFILFSKNNTIKPLEPKSLYKQLTLF